MRKKRVCEIDGCDKVHYGKGYCEAHYFRWKRNGHPLAGRITHGAAMQWLKTVAVNYAGDDCLFWPFSKNSWGYGTVYGSEHGWLASRVVCAHVHGPPPTPNHEAAHSCGNGKLSCVSPSHLSWKTRAENERDKLDHGTLICGEDSNFSKLTAKEVLAIRKMHGCQTQQQIADRYGTSLANVNSIVHRRTWKHLSEALES